MMVIFFAVKVLDKKHIIKEKKVPYVSREKEALAMTNHPFLVKLYFTFQDKEKLCILSLHFISFHCIFHCISLHIIAFHLLYALEKELQRKYSTCLFLQRENTLKSVRKVYQFEI